MNSEDPMTKGNEAGSPIPILTYHSLDSSGSVISIAPEVFKHQMDVLSDQGYGGISLGDLLDGWEGNAPLPARPVVITFDDGFGNVLEHAAPVLTALGFRATIFVVTGHCGGSSDWANQPSTVPRLPILSHSELRRLPPEVFEIGGHGLTHAPLTRVGLEQARQEMVDSKRKLEDAISLPVTVFAYPYGLHDRKSLELARVHYRGACTTRLRPARPSDDRWALPRVDMYYLRNPTLFGLFGTPLGNAYLRLRAAGRSCRAAAFAPWSGH
jgi:peptidoglycan/xylan/chitin deacetylase (PgdA/CDA1 family)